MKECAAEDGRREHETGYPELGWHQFSRSEAIRTNLDLWGRPMVSVVSREKLDESVCNFSCFVQWSEATG